ncbi:hypothetical protein D3C73_1596940 [compost metagenome]
MMQSSKSFLHNEALTAQVYPDEARPLHTELIPLIGPQPCLMEKEMLQLITVQSQ